MLCSLNEMLGYELSAEDGDVGRVRDFLFDDVGWEIRYIVVETGSWLGGREVLISPKSASSPVVERRRIPVSLTRKQVEDSPPLDAHRPVSREMEARIARHFRWPAYWEQPLTPALVPAVAGQADPDLGRVALDEPHLRSLREVTGYHIEAQDGSIGHVEDFIEHLTFWKIRYMVVDTRNWLPGDKVIVALRWIRDIDWREAKVHVDLTKESIENAPQYDPPVTPEYETELYNYYGRPYP